MATISGALPAMVTPFGDDGALDILGARRLARHLVDNGAHGIVAAGTTGESPTLSDAEKRELFDAVRDEIGGDGTLICGTGSNDTHHTVELTRAAVSAGAAEAAGETPVVLYNIPSRCVVNLDPELLAELAAEIPNVVAVKQANDDELGPIEGLDLLAGNDGVFLRTLELGGTGGILVSANLVPGPMRELYDAAIEGDLERAREIDASLQPIYEATTVTSNPIPVKAGVEMLGLIGGRMRLPMVEADDEQRAVVRSALERHGVLAASPR
jgi:4-hydroxy-tetrahydrodipicolinate synthase